MTGKFKTNAEIIKRKYRKKIGVKSENTFKAKNTVIKPPEEGEKDSEEKEYKSDRIKIKITAEENFFSSFLKLPECIPIDIQVCLKKHFSHSEVEKGGSLKFFLRKCGLDTKADMPYDKM